MRFNVSLISLCFLLSLTIADAQYNPSTRQSAEQLDGHARQAMQEGNYAVAFCIWQPLANAGDSTAQFNIGWMYHNGYGLRIDDETALYWWLKSASKGMSDAHFALGDLYANGQGVEKNSAIALGWYISAAIKGHSQAQETLLNLLGSEDRLTQNTLQLLLQSDSEILGDTMSINVDKANTRRGPDKSYRVVATLERGTSVIPLKEKNGWTYIGIIGQGKTAWVFSQLISKPAGIYSVTE